MGGPDGKHMTEEQMSIAEAFMIHLLNKNKLKVVGITGGEPMMSPNIDRVFYFLKCFKDKLNRANANIELHTNGSFISKDIDIEEYRNLFDNIYIPDDIFHRRFRKNGKNKIKYEKLSVIGKVVINNYDFMIDSKLCIVLRDKGRALDLMDHMIREVEGRGCIYSKFDGGLAPAVAFTPDNISFCAEASHKHSVGSSIPYTEDFDEIIEKAIEYRYLKTGNRCPHPCKFAIMDLDSIKKGFK